MGYYCTVPQCTSLAGKTKNVKFHRFPRDVTMADKWNIILKRGKPYTKYSKVCSLHFTQADYNVTTMGQWKTLSKDAVPSQNLPKCHADGTVMVIRKSRTVKYRDGRKDSTGDKSDKWSNQSQMVIAPASPTDLQNSNVPYRLQTLSAIASTLPPQMLTPPPKPKKQDAIMQTDPVQSEDDNSQPDNSYNEPVPAFHDPLDIYQYKEKDYSPNNEKYSPLHDKYPQANEKYPQASDKYPQASDKYPQANDKYPQAEKKYAMPKDFSKQDDYLRSKEYEKQEDYMPRTNEEYNKEAEKYALERKSHNSSVIDYQKIPDSTYKNVQDLYMFDKDYPRAEYPNYQYTDADILRNQQHNLEMLQQQHRINENQNFFNENHIKQEVDMTEEDKYSGMFDRAKDQIDVGMYGDPRAMSQRQLEHLQHQVKQEPETAGCESVMQPQGSPYYAPNGHTNSTASRENGWTDFDETSFGGYYGQLSRPGPELLIAKQNALAAHTQLWQNTMKRPFFYSETPHYSPIHRYEDLSRILQ